MAAAIARSPRLGEFYATDTANPGIAALAKTVEVSGKPAATKDLPYFCDHHAIDLVVIGPEDPLAAGLADKLSTRKDGTPRFVFGPSAAAARLEADKAYAKSLMRAGSIPTAEGRVFKDAEAAIAYVESRDDPVVVKAAGLAKGKGVVVPETTAEAVDAVRRIMIDKAFGDAGTNVVIEEKLVGREASVLALVDGRNVMLLPPCRDHKRLRDNDMGPNTGGMGAFCPATDIDDATMSIIERDVLVAIVDALRRDGAEFRGVLYAGVMLTPAGPKVLEYNVRFGDPECQPMLARLTSDPLDLMLRTAQGSLDGARPTWDDRAAVCIVLAAHGYPDDPRKGDVITGIDKAEAMADVSVQYAGVRRLEDGSLVTAGGRVLGVTALGTNVVDARAKAYAAANVIEFEGKHMRRDIAVSAVAARV